MIMNPLKKIQIGSVVIACALIAACASESAPEGPSGTPLPSQTYQETYHVAPLDTIAIKHRNGSIDTLQVTIEDGLEYPAGERLKVIGHTPDEVAAVLKERDSSIASVEVSEFKGNRISVTGEVNIQTNFDLQDAPMRVLDAIASAGGFTPLAETSSVRLIRHSAGKVEVYQLNMHDVQRGKNVYYDMLLEPGDHIFVPKSFL
jgi:polysaccharide export outer membrane protein